MAVDVPWRAEICNEQVRFAAGRMTIPDAPGLGIELNEDAIARHPYESRDLRHYNGTLTAIRPPDAIDYFQKNSR
jgi:galactonate dehydratase